MDGSANSLIHKESILVSRNRPVAIIINTCTSLGSFLAEFLLEKGIQVIGIDDLTFASRRNIEEASKNKDFHFINFPIDQDEVIKKIASLKISRLDYAFFVSDKNTPDIILGKGIINFINLASEFRKTQTKEHGEKVFSDKPKLVFVSSINLYGKTLNPGTRVLKEAEAKFAKGIKHFKLNGRVVRLAEVFGPRMNFDEQNPLCRLIQATILDKLDDEKISLDFSERSLFVDDAVKLIAKSVLSGATSNKIYDGALLHPVRLLDIKQILLNPMWSEEHPIEITKLPPWPTPNLVKTMKELAWAPKTPILKALRETVAYFKERQDLIPKDEPKKDLFKMEKNWSFAGTGFLGDEVSNDGKVEDEEKEQIKGVKHKGGDFDEELKKEREKTFISKSRRVLGVMIVSGLIIYGLIWPLIYLGYQGYSIRTHLLTSKNLLEQGKFSQSKEEIKKAQEGVDIFQNIIDNSGILKKVPGVDKLVQKADKILDLTEEGIDGVNYATSGSQSLFETTKIISGESREDPTPYYEQAERDLGFAASKLSKVYASLSDDTLKQGMPSLITSRIDDLKTRLNFYLSLVDQTKSASELMPKITGIDGKRSYLVLLQNNLELRPTGGFIGSYAQLDFESGRLTNIKVDDIYSLDGALKEVIAPPADLRQDLGVERLFLRDSNFEPDYPTSARQASFFYRKEAGEAVHGVIAMDLKASGNLLDAVGGLDLPEYGEFVNGANLFERSVSHAEAGFFPGSQAKKNYLTSLQTQLFNKIFYLSKQNWPAIIQAIGKSLKEKHILVYLEDPTMFSYLASSNWSGVFPREGEKREGETADFLAVIESNMGANKVNYFLQRKINLDVSFTKEGLVRHELRINYKNTSPSDVFPAGKYKNRLKIYTPLGTKLTKATFGEADITSNFSSFSDYGRSAFSALIEVNPKESKILVFEYELAEALSFVDNLASYRMEVFKQPGLLQDPLDFNLTYPINYKLEEKPGEGKSGVQEVKVATDMQTDRVFQFKIKK